MFYPKANFFVDKKIENQFTKMIHLKRIDNNNHLNTPILQLNTSTQNQYVFRNLISRSCYLPPLQLTTKTC